MKFSEFLILSPKCFLCSNEFDSLYVSGDNGYDLKTKDVPETAPWSGNLSCGQHVSITSTDIHKLPIAPHLFDLDRFKINDVLIKLEKYQIKLFAHHGRIVITRAANTGSSRRISLAATPLIKLELKSISDWTKSEPELVVKIEKLLILK